MGTALSRAAGLSEFQPVAILHGGQALDAAMTLTDAGIGAEATVQGEKVVLTDFERLLQIIARHGCLHGDYGPQSTFNDRNEWEGKIEELGRRLIRANNEYGPDPFPSEQSSYRGIVLSPKYIRRVNMNDGATERHRGEPPSVCIPRMSLYTNHFFSCPLFTIVPPLAITEASEDSSPLWRGLIGRPVGIRLTEEDSAGHAIRYNGYLQAKPMSETPVQGIFTFFHGPHSLIKFAFQFKDLDDAERNFIQRIRRIIY